MNQTLNATLSSEDLRWLVGPEGAGLLAELSQAGGSPVAAAERLKRRFPPQRVHLALEQVELRRRAAGKFPEARRMFFLPETIQQATDIFIARYKARRFPAGVPMADLCCGIGGDLLGLAARGPVAAVDSSGAALIVAEANVRSLLLPEHDAQDWEFCLGKRQAVPRRSIRGMAHRSGSSGGRPENHPTGKLPAGPGDDRATPPGVSRRRGQTGPGHWRA